MTALLHPEFLFAHLPKTAGAFMVNLLAQVSGHKQVERLLNGRTGHVPLDEFSEDERARLIIAGIRDPWSWYISYFHFFQYEDGRPWPELSSFKSSADSGWKETVERMLHGPTGPVTMKNIDGPRDVRSAMERLEIGFYSWYYLRMFFPDGQRLLSEASFEEIERRHDELCGVNVFVDTEQATVGMRDLFVETELLEPHIALQQCPLNAGSTAGRARRVSPDRDAYFHPGLEQDIARRDRLIVHRFGYDPQKTARPEPTTWIERGNLP